MYRRNRRNKLWYRKPRFNNRKKGSNWFAPSINRNYDAHIALINKIKKILPITKIVVEAGNFDIQKLINPEIKGKGYQQGNMYGFRNLNDFIIFREKGKCQFCGKEKDNDTWSFHHVIGRKTGSDSSFNIALLHSKCHKRVHKNHLEKSIKSNKSYKESAFMNMIKNRFEKDLNCEMTYGYTTYAKRIELGLSKTHINDAFVIAGGTKQTKCLPISAIQKRKNNRSVQLNRKGFKPSIRRHRYVYQPKDLVTIDNKEYEVVGVFNYGKRIFVKKKDAIKQLNFGTKKIQKHFMNNSLIFCKNNIKRDK
jgi:hypothetical protein